MFAVKLGCKRERFGLIWALIASVLKIKLTNSASEEIKQLSGPSIIVHEALLRGLLKMILLLLKLINFKVKKRVVRLTRLTSLLLHVMKVNLSKRTKILLKTYSTTLEKTSKNAKVRSN